MKSISRVLKTFFSVTTLFSATLYADTIERSNDLGDRDIQAIREWINTKRQVTVREIGGALSLSGEVRAEFQATGETVNGVRQRGAGGATDLNSSAYDIEVNLMLDYRSERTWAAIKLEFDNNAGIFSGSYNRLKLEKAYFGCRMIDADAFTSDIEIGRRRLSNIVDSKLEFCAFFDGIWLKYDHGFEKVGDFYIHAGPFVINERINQYGYLGETGLFDIGGTGFYAKYSLIDWDTKDFKGTAEHDRFNFLVSQFILGYKFFPKPLEKVIIIYSAGLLNHKAKRLNITDYERANYGAYLGMSMGELKKQGDWAFDANYQILAAQAVPDFDVCGIGVGNASDSGFYTVSIDGKGGPTTRKTAAGNGNYRGFMLTLDYLITNNLTIEQQWQQSITLNQDIGPFRRFKQYEIELIYAF